MVTIIDSTIRQTVYETIYDTINVATSTFGASSAPSVYGGYPDERSVSFPCIIIQPVNVSDNEFTIDTTRTSSTKDIVVITEIYATKNKDLDIIADGIVNTLKSPISGIFLTNTEDAYGIMLPNDNKIKQKTLTFTFMRR